MLLAFAKVASKLVESDWFLKGNFNIKKLSK